MRLPLIWLERRKQIGMVFSATEPFPFSVYENVTYGLKLAGHNDRKFLDEQVERALNFSLFGMKSKII